MKAAADWNNAQRVDMVAVGRQSAQHQNLLDPNQIERPLGIARANLGAMEQVKECPQ